MGAATGGEKGNGTINAAGAYYSNGTVGVSAGSFSAITAITSTLGIVTQLTGTSDERLKNVVGEFSRGLKELIGIKPIRYYWNQTGREVVNSPDEWVGLSAQNVQKTIPEAVGTEEWQDGREWLTLNDRTILCTLVNAVNELRGIIERQQSEIDELKKK